MYVGNSQAPARKKLKISSPPSSWFACCVEGREERCNENLLTMFQRVEGKISCMHTLRGILCLFLHLTSINLRQTNHEKWARKDLKFHLKFSSLKTFLIKFFKLNSLTYPAMEHNSSILRRRTWCKTKWKLLWWFFLPCFWLRINHKFHNFSHLPHSQSIANFAHSRMLMCAPSKRSRNSLAPFCR